MRLSVTTNIVAQKRQTLILIELLFCLNGALTEVFKRWTKNQISRFKIISSISSGFLFTHCSTAKKRG